MENYFLVRIPYQEKQEKRYLKGLFPPQQTEDDPKIPYAYKICPLHLHSRIGTERLPNQTKFYKVFNMAKEQ